MQEEKFVNVLLQTNSKGKYITKFIKKLLVQLMNKLSVTQVSNREFKCQVLYEDENSNLVTIARSIPNWHLEKNVNILIIKD